MVSNFDVYKVYTGWWFGTFVPMDWELHHPSCRIFFQKGRYTTNQYKVLKGITMYQLYDFQTHVAIWTTLAAWIAAGRTTCTSRNNRSGARLESGRGQPNLVGYLL